MGIERYRYLAAAPLAELSRKQPHGKAAKLRSRHSDGFDAAKPSRRPTQSVMPQTKGLEFSGDAKKPFGRKFYDVAALCLFGAAIAAASAGPFILHAQLGYPMLLIVGAIILAGGLSIPLVVATIAATEAIKHRKK